MAKNVLTRKSLIRGRGIPAEGYRPAPAGLPARAPHAAAPPPAASAPRSAAAAPAPAASAAPSPASAAVGAERHRSAPALLSPGSSKSFFSPFSGSPATCNAPSHPRRCLASRQVRLGWQRGSSIPPHPHTLVPSISYREPVASSSQHRTTHVTPFLLPLAGEARQAGHGPPSPVCLTSGLIRSQTPGSCTSPSLMGNSYLSPKPRREDEGGCWGSYCLPRGECIPLKVC